MKVGVFATFMSPRSTPETILSFAGQAERAGVDSIWMGEHVVLFERTEFPYPGSDDGRIPVPEGGGLLDPVATFGFLASAAPTLRFGTGITLVPQRNPLYTAKELATLDWLTQGRMDFGIGVGWCKEEVLACGYGWDDRGERCDEFLTLMRKLWTEPVVDFAGNHIQVRGARMDPKPVQQPHPPIIVGGHSARAMARAAEFGGGWYGFAVTPKQLPPLLRALDEALDARGRSRADFQVIVTPPTDDADTVRAFKDLGVTRLVLHLGSQRPERITARLQVLEQLVNVAAGA